MDCDQRVKVAFQAGRRAGIWLVYNGPRAKAKERGMDRQARRREDAVIGEADLSSVFAGAEREARLGAMAPLDKAMEGMDDAFGRAEGLVEERDRIRKEIRARINADIRRARQDKGVIALEKMRSSMTEKGRVAYEAYKASKAQAEPSVFQEKMEAKYDEEEPVQSNSSSSVFGGTAVASPIKFKVKRPQVAPASAPRVKITASNAGNYIGRTVFFTAGGQKHSGTILRVGSASISIDGGPRNLHGNLTFSREMYV